MPVEKFVERRNGVLCGRKPRFAGVDICEFRAGASAESIRQNLATLSLEQVYGAITFYLGHQTAAAAYLAAQQTMWDERERVVKPVSPELQKRIEEARKRAFTPQM